jgi:hypothetical protein
MGKRKTARSAFDGEYASPDAENSADVQRSRLILMRTVKRVFPKFLEKFSTDVFPLFDQAAKNGTLARQGYDFEQVLFADNPRRVNPLDPRLTPLEVLAEENGVKAALLKWANEFNAATDWLMVSALRTLRRWRLWPQLRLELTWDASWAIGGRIPATDGRFKNPGAGRPFEFSFHEWETRLLTWAKYRAEAHRRFEEKLSEYRKETRELVESEGLIRVRRKYSPVNLEWFVLYQFAGESSKRIAERAARNNKAVDDSTVLKGIKAAAQLIAWKHLREPKRRPQNRKIQ